MIVIQFVVSVVAPCFIIYKLSKKICNCLRFSDSNSILIQCLESILKILCFLNKKKVSSKFETSLRFLILCCYFFIQIKKIKKIVWPYQEVISSFQAELTGEFNKNIFLKKKKKRSAFCECVKNNLFFFYFSDKNKNYCVLKEIIVFWRKNWKRKDIQKIFKNHKIKVNGVGIVCLNREVVDLYINNWII